MAEPSEPSRREVEATLREADRVFRVRGDRVTVRNPMRPYALVGVAAGVATTIALAVLGDAERGSLVLGGLLLLGAAAAALGLVLGVVGVVLRSVRPAPRALFGVALSCLIALVVAMAAAVALGLGR